MNQMKLGNKTYDILKWIAVIAMPAIGVAIGTIGKGLGYDQTDTILLVWTAIDTLLGSLLGVSTRSYNKGDE